MKPKIIFDDSTLPFIFETFNITIGDDEFLYKDDELILDIFHKKPLTKNQFGGICKEGIIRGDLLSIINLVDQGIH